MKGRGEEVNGVFVCNSKAATTAALQTIAGTFSAGTQRDALISVINWIEENYPQDFTEETRAKIQRIYDETFDDAARKAITWEVHGGEPEHGTRVQVPFLFNADAKTWELEKEMPSVWTEPNPDILPQSNEGFYDNEDSDKGS